MVGDLLLSGLGKVQGKGLGKVPRMCGGREGDCNAGVFVCECVCGTRSVHSGSGGECSLRGVAAADLVDQPVKIDLVHHPAEPDGCAGASSQAGQRASRSPSKVPSLPEKCCYVSGWRWGGSAKVNARADCDKFSWLLLLVRLLQNAGTR